MTKNVVSSLWRSLPAAVNSKIEACIDAAIDRAGSTAPVYVFFRADDVGVPSEQFARLMDLFSRHQVPLSLAIVPAWLSRPRWQNLRKLGQRSPALWCWHHHGWRHVNHEPFGKKQEFGPCRPLSRIRSDLTKGRSRLENLLDNDFCPVFTPPWNRCDIRTLELLKAFRYRAVSRNQGSLPPSPAGLSDFSVNIDLHTRKEVNPATGWERLFTEIDQAVSSGLCGIMIHHRKMNDLSFTFVEILLQILRRRKDLFLVHLGDLVRIFPNP